MVVLKSCTNTVCKSLYVCVFVQCVFVHLSDEFCTSFHFHLLFSKKIPRILHVRWVVRIVMLFCYSKVHVVLLTINGGASLFTKIESFESALVIDWMYCNVVSYDSPSLTAHAYNH